jgi:hypothetical protein
LYEGAEWFTGLPKGLLGDRVLDMEFLIVLADIAIMALVAAMLDSIF